MSSAVVSDLQKDIRLIERNLAKGFLSKSAHEKLVRELPDVAEKGEWRDIDFDADASGEDEG